MHSLEGMELALRIGSSADTAIEKHPASHWLAAMEVD